MDSVKFRQMKAVLEDLIDKEKDSLRFYNLGDKYQNKVEHIGAKPGFDVTDTLIFWKDDLPVRAWSKHEIVEDSHLVLERICWKKK